MTQTRRQQIEREDVAANADRRLLWLWVLVGVSGVAGLIGFLQEREPAWPRPFAFGWAALFVVALVGELRARRARRRA